MHTVCSKRQGGQRKEESTNCILFFSGSFNKCDKINHYENEHRNRSDPKGMTSVIQPLNVSLNKSFKDRLRKLWNNCVASYRVQIIKYGNFKNMDIVTVIE